MDGWWAKVFSKPCKALAIPQASCLLVSTVMRNGRITREMMGLPLEISSNMPASKILLANFKLAARLLFWALALISFIHSQEHPKNSGNCPVYTNLAALQEELVVLGS